MEARRTRARTAGAVAAGALGLLGLTACGTSATRAVVQPTTPVPVSPAPTAVLAPIPARPGLLIGGLATTVPGVDMVVSATTGQRIGVPFGNGLVVAVEGDPDRATARIREVLGPKPAIRRIAAVGGALGVPAGPLLPSVTVSAPPVVPAVPGAPAAVPPAARHATRPDARPAAPVTPPVGY